MISTYLVKMWYLKPFRCEGRTTIQSRTTYLGEFRFIDFGILKKKSFDDCQHIAAAILAGCDIITSWNFKHIVNVKTVRGVKIIITLEGYKDLLIYPPSVLLEMCRWLPRRSSRTPGGERLWCWRSFGKVNRQGYKTVPWKRPDCAVNNWGVLFGKDRLIFPEKSLQIFNDYDTLITASMIKK